MGFDITSEEVEKFKEKYKDFFELLKKEETEYVVDNKLSLTDIIENGYSNGLSDKYFLRKDEQGIFVCFNSIRCILPSLFDLPIPRMIGGNLHINDYNGYGVNLRYLFNNLKLKNLHIYSGSEQTKFKFKNSQISFISFSTANAKNVTIESSKIDNLTYNLSKINELNLKSSSINDIFVQNSITKKIMFNNTTNETFEINTEFNDRDFKVKNIIIENSTFKKVDLKISDEKDRSLKKIQGEFTGIEKLKISGNVEIGNIINNQSLKSLDIGYFLRENDEIKISKIDNCPNLETVYIKGNEFLESITNCPKLSKLHLERCCNFSSIQNCDNINEVYLEKLKLKKLENLPKLKEAAIKLEEFESIKNCPSLNNLFILKYSNSPWNKIEDFPKLNRLYIENVIEDKNPEITINNCSNVEILNLNNISLKNSIDGEKYLNLNNLVMYNISQCNIINTFNNVKKVVLKKVKTTTPVTLNNFPNTKFFNINNSNNISNTNFKKHSIVFFNTEGSQQKITSAKLLADKRKIIEDNNGTQLMFKFLKNAKGIGENHLDIEQVNIRDNKDLGAAVYCTNLDQLKFLYKNNYEFREFELQLVSKKMKNLYEKYYLLNKCAIGKKENIVDNKNDTEKENTAININRIKRNSI